MEQANDRHRDPLDPDTDSPDPPAPNAPASDTPAPDVPNSDDTPETDEAPSPTDATEAIDTSGVTEVIDTRPSAPDAPDDGTDADQDRPTEVDPAAPTTALPVLPTGTATTGDKGTGDKATGDKGPDRSAPAGRGEEAVTERVPLPSLSSNPASRSASDAPTDTADSRPTTAASAAATPSVPATPAPDRAQPTPSGPVKPTPSDRIEPTPWERASHNSPDSGPSDSPGGGLPTDRARPADAAAPALPVVGGSDTSHADAEDGSDQDRRPIGPQRIEATGGGGRGRRPVLIAGLLVAVLLIAGIGYWLFTVVSSNSDDNRIREAVNAYATGLQDGDLEAVRAGTCGDLAQFYAGLDESGFSAVHDAGVRDGTIPRIDSIDAIRLDTEDSAIVAVTVSTEQETTGTTRTFDLRREDDQWKVCG